MSEEIKTVLQVENLVKYFPVKGNKRQQVRAVDGVSFYIEKGETLGLVGESGCGKSTVARTVTRIYTPTQGQIKLFGEDIGGLSPKALHPHRRRMQMIFQDPYSSLNGRMTVGSILEEPLIAHGKNDKTENRKLIQELLVKVGLESEHAGRYPHEFSGGQRQRICIARALILKPDLIICDEAISALDVSIQAQIVNMLKEFQEDMGLTYLFIAHDLSMVRYISHRVGVMYLGRIVEMCSSAEIYGNPLHPYTKGLLAAVPIPDPDVTKGRELALLDGDVPSPIDPPEGCHFHPRCSEATDICRRESPEYRMLEMDHYVACHLYD